MYYLYILTNKHHTVLYIGVTRNLNRRIQEHLTKANPDSFTAKYNLDKLVYFEEFDRVEDAFKREKQIQGWTFKKKNALVEGRVNDIKDLGKKYFG